MSNRNPISSSQRRLLGDLRRETSIATYVNAHKRRKLDNADDEDDDDDDKIRPASGGLDDNDVAIFADTVYEEDDAEADAIYEAVDKRMQSRRQKQREANLQAELKKYRDANPTIRQQFSDLKSNLQYVSNDEWSSIPDIGDYSVKKQKFQTFTPAPDSLLEKARQETAYVATAADAGGAATDLTSITAGRTSVLEQTLDHAQNTLSVNNSIDANGYLNELTGVNVSTESEIGDIKKARLLLKSIIRTNPSHAPGWIAAARLEETAGKLSTAQKLILNGCRKCPKDEDVWIEAARLHPPDVGRRILAQAVKSVPTAVKIWMQAATLEDSAEAKKRVIRKALEVIPRYALLWKTAIDMEEKHGARLLLRRAVTCAPKSSHLWLALAKLEPYDEAKKVLRRGRSALPSECAMWMTEAKLEEAENGPDCPEIDLVITEAVKMFSDESKLMSHEDWLKEAVSAEQAAFKGTVRAIIRSISTHGEKADEGNEFWITIATKMQKDGHLEVARAIYDQLVTDTPTDSDLWRQYAEFENQVNDSEKTRAILARAVQACPDSEILWLMLAKQAWKSGSADEAREILKKAFDEHEKSEHLWLAAAKVETEMGEFERARYILETARKEAPSAKVFMKSALLERQLRNGDMEKSLLEEGINLFPDGYKLWLMLAQWYERREVRSDSQESIIRSNGDTKIKEMNNYDNIQGLNSTFTVYARAVKQCSYSPWLWIGYARCEERKGSISKARAVLGRGLENCKGKNDIDLIWRERVYLEVRAKETTAAQSIMARALQECGKSGRLWALAIALEPRLGQKARSVDAIKNCPQDVYVILEVARYIWRSGKIEKARQWMERAVTLDSDWGDAWATWLAFENENGDEHKVNKVEEDALKAEPHHGDVWAFISKQVGNENMKQMDILRRTAQLLSKETSTTGF